MTLDILLATLLSVSAVCYLLLGVRLVSLRSDAGRMPAGALFMIISFWVVGGAVELMSTSFMMFSVGRTLHFIGTALLPVSAYLCFRELVGSVAPTRMVVLLLLIPVVSITLAATNQYHEFMWYLPATNVAGEFLTRPRQWGTWFLFMHAPYSYAVMAAAVVTLVAHFSTVATAHRRGLLLLIVACIAPASATLLYDLGVGPNTISTVPLVFAAMLPIYVWLLMGQKLVEFAPLAYETVFQNMQDPVVVIDDQQRIIGLNHGAEQLLDLRERDALREPLDAVLGEGATGVYQALDTGKPQKMMTATGRFMHVQVSSISSKGGSGSNGKVVMFRDVSDVERAQTEVRNSEMLLRTLIDHSVNGIIRLRWVRDDERGKRVLRCIFANAAAGRFLAADPDDLIDRDAAHIVRLASSGMSEEDVQSVLEHFDQATQAKQSIDVELLHGRASPGRWLRMICEHVGDDIAATFVDVTDGKAKERHMESIAWSDPLTGVLNRRGFERDAAQRLSESEDDATGALLFIDLNDFKKINDLHGHEIGDQLLTVAAARLRKSLRSCDIIGRPGGDEFVALVPDVDAAAAEELARRLTESLDEPYLISKDTLKCAASIGMALYPKNANTLTGLLREADQAMYRAKARSRDVPNIRGDGLLEKAV